MWVYVGDWECMYGGVCVRIYDVHCTWVYMSIWEWMYGRVCVSMYIVQCTWVYVCVWEWVDGSVCAYKYKSYIVRLLATSLYSMYVIYL